MPLDFSQLNRSMGAGPSGPEKRRNPLAAGVASGVDSLQGLGYNALGAVFDATGYDGGRDWALEQAARNEFEAQASGRPDLERVEDQTLGSALPFAAYQISKQLPQIGGAMALGAVAPQVAIPAGLTRAAALLPRALGGGGLQAGASLAARRAALGTGQTFSRNLLGGAGLGTVMGAGSLYGESVDAGDPSPYAALAAAPLYGITEGIPQAVLGGTLAKGAFTGNMGMRMAKSAGVNALGGATSELAQNEMEMAFNPTLSAEEQFSRRLNAGVVGGMAEGAIGSLGGIRRPRAPQNLLPRANAPVDAPAPPPDTQPRLDPYAMPGTQGNMFAWSDEGTASPLPSYGQSSALDDLRSDLGELANMAQQAYEAGDRAQLEAINAAIQQTQQQIRALEPQDTSRAPLLPSGVNEMVSGQPIELFNYELDGNMMPFVDAGFQPPQVDLLQQALLWEPQAGLPFEPVPVPPSPPQSPTTKRRALTADEMSYEGQPLDGEVERVEQDARRAETRAALLKANGGRANAQLLRFIPEFSAALAQGPDAVQAVIGKYDTDRSTLRPEVLETADQLARAYQQQDINGMAMEGIARARPGATPDDWGVASFTDQTGKWRKGVNPEDTTDSANIARERNQQAQEQEQLAGAIADTDARVAGGQQQRSAQARRSALDTVLEGAANAGNARNSFIRALREQGFNDTIVRPEEQQVIDRFFNAKEAFPEEGSALPSAPNELGDVVPEKTAPPAAPKGKPARQNENKSFQLSSPPSTDADLAAVEKARAKRERKAGDTAEDAPEAESGNTKQGKLFTAKGKPTVAADNNPPPKPPRKSKVKTKVGEQEVELEVSDAESQIAAMQRDVDKFEAFVACLRKK